MWLALYLLEIYPPRTGSYQRAGGLGTGVLMCNAQDLPESSAPLGGRTLSLSSKHKLAPEGIFQDPDRNLTKAGLELGNLANMFSSLKQLCSARCK